MTKTTTENPRFEQNLLLERLGDRVRQARARRGMSRRILAEASGVSQRYLAQLESGTGNPSVSVLAAVAAAMDVAPDDLLDDREQQSVEYLWMRNRVRSASETELKAWVDQISSQRDGQRRHIALIGLRGAGKSTLGVELARRCRLPFVELVQEIERSAGMSVGDIFASGGQGSYRMHESDALRLTCEHYKHAVIAVGGSLVSQPTTFEYLLQHCVTIWVKAQPRQHMERVMAQGDHRPMANHRDAMNDLKRMLNERKSLYERAHMHIDTSSASVADCVDELLQSSELEPIIGEQIAAIVK